MIERLEHIIFYFEGTCEICLANRGIELYRHEINDLLQLQTAYDNDVRLRLHFAQGIIEYKLGNYDLAFKSWQTALAYAHLINDAVYIGKIHSYLSIYYYLMKDTEKENYYFASAETIFRENDCYEELACHYINILWYKRYENEQEKVIEYIDTALHQIQKSDSRKNARVYLHSGYIYKTIFKDYTKSINYLIKSNELCREYGFVEMEAMTFHVLADTYFKINNSAETIRIYIDILQNDKFSKITANLKVAILCSLISCYLQVKDVDNVQMYLQQISDLLPDVQTNIRESYYAVMLGLQAEYYTLTGNNLGEALQLIQKSRDIYNKNKMGFVVEEFDYPTTYREGYIYLGLKNFPKALECYLELLEIAQLYGRFAQKYALEKLAHFYECTEDYSQALYYYKKADEICSQIRTANTQKQYEAIYREFISTVKTEELSRLNEVNISLEKDSYQDVLTSLYNRHYLHYYLEQIKKNAKNSTGMTVMMIDVDYFKRYNDNYGHDSGDEVLKRVAGILKKVCGGNGTVIRYGGDEFIIYLEDTSKEESVKLAAAIIRTLQQESIEHAFSAHDNRVTVSIGIASIAHDDKLKLEDMVGLADRALYYSKNNGRNRFTHMEDIA